MHTIKTQYEDETQTAWSDTAAGDTQSEMRVFIWPTEIKSQCHYEIWICLWYRCSSIWLIFICVFYPAVFKIYTLWYVGCSIIWFYIGFILFSRVKHHLKNKDDIFLMCIHPSHGRNINDRSQYFLWCVTASCALWKYNRNILTESTFMCFIFAEILKIPDCLFVYFTAGTKIRFIGFTSSCCLFAQGWVWKRRTTGEMQPLCLPLNKNEK